MPDCFPHLTSLSALAYRYDLILSDVWGVIHDGAAIHPAARAALSHFRESNGSVILLSNASRLSVAVTPELERLGMPASAYDALITSGDITREFLSKRPGISIFDIGPGSASTLCEGLDVRFATLTDAEIGITAGAFQQYDVAIDRLLPLLEEMLARNLVMLCANPDVITQLGEHRVQCSGALAEAYSERGGSVLYCGKPHAPIFEQALGLASALRGDPVPRERVLVIGDSLRTDIAGAVAKGFDTLFVASGIHAQELGGREPTTIALERVFSETGLTPTAVTWRLAW